jgi:uncharacterized protein
MGCYESKDLSVSQTEFRISEISNQSTNERYPPVVIKQPGKEELNFYLHIRNTKKLACSLVCPYTFDPSLNLEDKLSSLTPDEQKQKVIIVCHGFLSWRNQLLIANLASRLSSELSCFTLRFDFTACGQSDGSWRFSNYEEDFLDLCHVTKFVQTKLNLDITCIIGHSQGSAAVIRHASNQRLDHGPVYVNLAGRFKEPYDFKPESFFSPEQNQQLENEGKCILSLGLHKDLTIRSEDVESKRMYDVSKYAKCIPDNIKVLTIHGIDDRIVPVENASKFDKWIKNHFLSLISNCDHNFNGLVHMDTLVIKISEFIKVEGTI